jgi:tRNA (adenine57-N1/adenine58-N1)-methyltransferase
MAEVSDLALLVAPDQKRYLIRLKEGERLHTHLGVFKHDDIIGQTWGTVVQSQLGQPAMLLSPSVVDLITHLKRGTQIVYPKDAAYLIFRLNLRAGSRVIEAGTGSAGLTAALAWSVAPEGEVFSYEVRPEIYLLARRNLERIGLLRYVTMVQASIADGFLQRDVDAVVLDVREPWHYLEHVRSALNPGGFFAGLLPTTNQVTRLLSGLESSGFADVAVEELLLRSYKPVPERLRPDDMMIAHTGFLVSARCLTGKVDMSRWLPKERQRFRARRKMAEKIAAEEEKRSQSQEQGGRKYPRLPLP